LLKQFKDIIAHINKMMSQEKKHISIVVTGHVDSGKSTTTGHLIFKLGGIKEREMTKLQQKADEMGKSSFAFAYFMDSQKEERERGVTIQCNTKEFYTDSYHYTIVDAPGHRDYVNNMISGAGQADAAIMLVPAEKGGFEAAIAKGNRSTGEVEGQTRQHARLLALLGIEQVIVGINKMDTCGWSKDRYDEIQKEMSLMLQQSGLKPKKIPFIPYSGFHGENLVEKTDKMPWYDGWCANINPKTQVKGVTMLDALENFIKPPVRNETGPLRIPVSGVYNIKGVGAIIAGRVEQGIVNEGDPLAFAPSNITGCKMFSMEMHHTKYSKAIPGDNIGMSIKGLSKENMPKTGDVIYNPTQGVCLPVKSFVAMINVQDHPGQLKTGFCPIIHVRTSKVSCKMTKINWKMSKKTGDTKDEEPGFVERGETAEVVFEPAKPLFLEAFTSTPGLGRIAVMNSNSLVMLGKVVSVEY
jgi:elongation factor 1-alpha